MANENIKNLIDNLTTEERIKLLEVKIKELEKGISGANVGEVGKKENDILILKGQIERLKNPTKANVDKRPERDKKEKPLDKGVEANIEALKKEIEELGEGSNKKSGTNKNIEDTTPKNEEDKITKKRNGLFTAFLERMREKNIVNIGENENIDKATRRMFVNIEEGEDIDSATKRFFSQEK
jgi:hypothetical protein